MLLTTRQDGVFTEVQVLEAEEKAIRNKQGLVQYLEQLAQQEETAQDLQPPSAHVLGNLAERIPQTVEQCGCECPT